MKQTEYGPAFRVNLATLDADTRRAFALGYTESAIRTALDDLDAGFPDLVRDSLERALVAITSASDPAADEAAR